MHADYDSAESIGDSDLEDGELRKMMALPPHLRSREDCESSRMPIPPAKPAALFSLGTAKPGHQFKSSVFRNADPSNVGRSLLEGKKDHLLSQAKSELMRQEHQVGSLNICISELQQQAHAQRLEVQDAQHGYFESRREQVRLQEELSMKEKVLRDTQIRSMREMGEMKRAQELRVDEFSVQKLRENHETRQKLTSQLQEVQEQMNSMSDSGDVSIVVDFPQNSMVGPQKTANIGIAIRQIHQSTIVLGVEDTIQKSSDYLF